MVEILQSTRKITRPIIKINKLKNVNVHKLSETERVRVSRPFKKPVHLNSIPWSIVKMLGE